MSAGFLCDVDGRVDAESRRRRPRAAGASLMPSPMPILRVWRALTIRCSRAPAIRARRASCPRRRRRALRRSSSRPRRVPRSAQGDRHGRHQGAPGPRRHGQGRHRRQRPGRPQDLQRGRARRPSSCLLGDEVEKMTDEQLADAAEKTTLFARVSPAHKQRIIKALQSRKHTVGFMGDGINDAPALHAADVGHQRRHRRGHRQGVGRHDPAREVAARAGRGRARRAQGLLEHHQVRAHGRVEQLRQHVQRARGERLRALPADAADPDPGQQPALRHRPDRHPDRRRRPRAARRRRARGTSRSSPASSSSSARARRSSTTRRTS